MVVPRISGKSLGMFTTNRVPGMSNYLSSQVGMLCLPSGEGMTIRSAHPRHEDFGRCTMELYRLGWSGRGNRPISPII
jgi:hypothetical protein